MPTLSALPTDGVRPSARPAPAAPSLPDAELLHAPALALARLVRRGTVSPTELLEAHVRRVEAVNPIVNAVVQRRYEAARAEAKAAEAALARRSVRPEELPPFLGVPCTIKEHFAFAGLPNTAGLVRRRAAVAREDATLVKRMKAAGLVPLGTTNVPEALTWHCTYNKVYGQTRNPWSPAHSAGGSSGGEGAIIGAGGSPIGLGGDIGGSIRMPAIFNGIAGHKATGGRIPETGCWPGARGLIGRYKVCGPMGRTVGDLAALMPHLAGPDGHDPTVDGPPWGTAPRFRPSEITVAWFDDNGVVSPSDDVRRAVARTVGALEAMGFRVRRWRPTQSHRSLEMWMNALEHAGGPRYIDTLGDFQGVDLRRAWLRAAAGRGEHILPCLALATVEAAASRFPAWGRRMADLRLEMQREIESELGPRGVLVCPVFHRAAPRIGWESHASTLGFTYSGMLNPLELPATAVPTGFDEGGLPLGVQVAAIRNNDHLTLWVAEQIEAAFGAWRPAPVPGAPTIEPAAEAAARVPEVRAPSGPHPAPSDGGGAPPSAPIEPGAATRVAIPPHALGRAELERRMQAYREQDLPWRGGRVWAYVYDPGPEIEEVQKRAFLEFLGENALDPTVFPSLLRFENELVAMAATHLRGGPDVVGNFTSGGTESVLLAVKTARDWARAHRPGITEPEMVLPVTAHACFQKAASYFGVRPVLVPVGRDFRADPRRMEEAITDRTILLVGSAPSYAHGVVDPIRELGQLALDRGLLFHVDGCIGGFLLPYFARLGAPVPDFDFSVPGVTSISMDFHKYAFCPKGASVVLYRDKELRKFQIFSCSSWTGYTILNPTIQSTKSGGPLAAAWATLHAIGDDGYLARARDMLAATRALTAGIARIPGLHLLAEPDMTLFAFSSREVSPFEIVDEMKQRGWYVQPQLGFHGSESNVHLSITPASLGHVEPFLADLRASVDAARTRGPGELARQLGGALDAVDPSAIDDATLEQLMAMAGIGGSGLPERMADINRVLEALPAPLTERVLRAFLNDLYRPASA
ncbi:MAG: aminotransferase class V-fold PLP-dependent enzyme [Polyangiaceae bacterium]|nr:aminotransferase class V-fold PLP-dependent enzyme [Polyangiaceae bacterium]